MGLALAGKTGLKSLTCPAQAYVFLSVCVWAYLQPCIFVSSPHSVHALQSMASAADICPAGCVVVRGRYACGIPFPYRLVAPPPRSFVADVSCRQTGRFAGWWGKSQRAEKQTGRSPDLLGPCVSVRGTAMDGLKASHVWNGVHCLLMLSNVQEKKTEKRSCGLFLSRVWCWWQRSLCLSVPLLQIVLLPLLSQSFLCSFRENLWLIWLKHKTLRWS